MCDRFCYARRIAHEAYPFPSSSVKPLPELEFVAVGNASFGGIWRPG